MNELGSSQKASSELQAVISAKFTGEEPPWIWKVI
jgi:hypothetical protein